ncbi:MAG TPA: hypothetical protein VGC99_12570 [Candidatus Tectomicrobia bacterium]
MTAAHNSLQRVLAAGTTLRRDREDGIDRLDWQQRPRLPLVTGLPAGSLPAMLATGPLAQGLGWVARRGLRRRPRVLLQLPSHLIDRGLQQLDGGLQRLDGLLQCSYPRFERSDVGLGLRWDALPHLW